MFDSVYGNAAMFPGGALRSSLATLPQYAPKSPPTTPPFSPPPTPPFSPPPSSLVPLAHRSPSDPTTSLRTAATKPHHDEAGEEDDEDDYNIASDLTGTSTAAVSNRSNPLIRTTSEDAQTAEPTLHTLESYNMQASDMVAASTGDTVDNTREEPFPDLEAGGYDAATRPFHPLAFDSLAEDGTHSPRDSEPLPFPSPQHASSMPEDFKVTGSQQSRSPTETKGFKTQQSMPTKLRRQENEDASYFKVRGWNSFGGVVRPASLRARVPACSRACVLAWIPFVIHLNPPLASSSSQYIYRFPLAFLSRPPLLRLLRLFLFPLIYSMSFFVSFLDFSCTEQPKNGGALATHSKSLPPAYLVPAC